MFNNPAAIQKVKRLYFSKKQIAGQKPIAAHIGGRAMANVYAGRVVLANGKRQAVAIKVFKHPLNAEQAHAYQIAIYDLALAGVRIPKMFMHKLPKGTPLGSGALQRDSWVLVSQLFGSIKRGPKMSNGNTNRFRTSEGEQQAVEELTKIANAGYKPLADIINNLETKRGFETIPVDLDFVVMHGRASAKERAKLLAQTLLQISKGPNVTYSKLLKYAFTKANPELRVHLNAHQID